MREKLIAVVADVLGVDPASLGLDSARADLAEWDSLAHIQIIGEIETRFSVKIPFEDVAGIKSVRDLVRYVGE